MLNAMYFQAPRLTRAECAPVQNIQATWQQIRSRQVLKIATPDMCCQRGISYSAEYSVQSRHMPFGVARTMDGVLYSVSFSLKRNQTGETNSRLKLPLINSRMDVRYRVRYRDRTRETDQPVKMTHPSCATLFA